MIKKHIFTLTGQCTACSAVQVLYFLEYKAPSKCQSIMPIKVTRVTSRSELLFQSVRVWLRFASRPTQIIRFSSGSLFAILKNMVQVQLRFNKISLKPVYKTPVQVRFDYLVFAFEKTSINTFDSFEKAVASQKLFVTRSSNINIVCCASFLKSQNYPAYFFSSFHQGNRHCD